MIKYILFVLISDPFSYYDTPYSFTYTIYGFRTHENYDPSTKVNDLAFVLTNNRMVYNAGVGPICTPPNGYKYEHFPTFTHLCSLINMTNPANI